MRCALCSLPVYVCLFNVSLFMHLYSQLTFKECANGFVHVWDSVCCATEQHITLLGNVVITGNFSGDGTLTVSNGTVTVHGCVHFNGTIEVDLNQALTSSINITVLTFEGNCSQLSPKLNFSAPTQSCRNVTATPQQNGNSYQVLVQVQSVPNCDSGVSLLSDLIA